MDENTLQRFMSKIQVQPNGCWHFAGKRGANGYGYFWLDGKSRLAHRVAYKHFVGPIPDEFEVDHLCHTRDAACVAGKSCRHRTCVNPADLEAVPKQVNFERSRGVAVANAAKTACDHGHPFDEVNTYVYPNGERGCRACLSAHNKAWSAKNRPASGPHCRDRTECPKGHPYDEANTRINSSGSRTCVTCVRASDRETKRRKRAALLAAQQG